MTLGDRQARSRPPEGPGKGPGSHPGPLARILLLAALTFVAFLTLTPSGTGGDLPSFFCVLCSTRGVADALANILLFLPIGALLSWNGLSLRTGLLAAVVLSSSIEGLQFFIPGRHSDLGDILTNGTGGMLGVLLFRNPRRWISPASPLRPRLFVLALALALGMPFLTGLLLVPAIPDRRLWSQWTPIYRQVEAWQGTLRGVTLGGTDLGDAGILTPEQREALRRGEVLEVDAVSGPPSRQLAPVVRIVDDNGIELALLAVRGDEVVWSRRTLARRIRMDSPELRWRGVLSGTPPGVPLGLAVGRAPGGEGSCLVAQGVTHCGQGHHAGRGWALVLAAEWLPEAGQRLLDHLWAAGLLFLVGFWTLPGAPVRAGLGVLLPLVALGVSGWMPALVPVPAPVLVAALLGWGVGRLLGSGRLRMIRPRTPLAVRGA